MITKKESDRVFDFITANGSIEMTKDIFYKAIHDRFSEEEKQDNVSALDIRIVNLPIECVFMMEQIPTEYDDDGFIIGFEMGLVMRPLPGQVFPYTGQQSHFLYSCFTDLNL